MNDRPVSGSGNLAMSGRFWVSSLPDQRYGAAAARCLCHRSACATRARRNGGSCHDAPGEGGARLPPRWRGQIPGGRHRHRERSSSRGAVDRRMAHLGRFQCLPLFRNFLLGKLAAFPFLRLHLAVSGKWIRGQILGKRVPRTPVGTIGAAGFPSLVRYWKHPPNILAGGRLLVV